MAKVAPGFGNAQLLLRKKRSTLPEDAARNEMVSLSGISG